MREWKIDSADWGNDHKTVILTFADLLEGFDPNDLAGKIIQLDDKDDHPTIASKVSKDDL
ncbi:MAG: hypothetical protein KAR39_05315 [Thermoplasmata archaeon]|nr:hypothetical protein [Thermoplasmata archaeon]